MNLRVRSLAQIRVLSLMGLVAGFLVTAWAADKGPKRSYEVPSIDKIARVDAKGRGWPGAKLASQSLYAFKTEVHPVDGDAYVVVTDHVDGVFLDALKRLVEFREGELLRLKDLGELAEKPAERKKLLSDLKSLHPRFVAIAPRKSSFHENVVLAFLDVISAIDVDPQLDAFPGWLVAADGKSFERLIDQTISFKAAKRNEIKPFTLCQVSAQEIRSQQKACIMDDYFDGMGIAMPSLSVRIKAPGITRELRSAVGDKDDRVIGALGDGRLLSGVPSLSKEALGQASLLMVYGHGAPGRICALSLHAFEEIDFSGKMVLCGACFSAMPAQSDFSILQRGPDGAPIQNHRERFVERVVSQGAIGVLAHMRLSDGFPSVFPVFESMMQGLSAGESVQRLLNATILRVALQRGQFCLAEKDQNNRRAQQKRNALLWVLIGDPALQVVDAAD